MAREPIYKAEFRYITSHVLCNGEQDDSPANLISTTTGCHSLVNLLVYGCRLVNFLVFIA